MLLIWKSEFLPFRQPTEDLLDPHEFPKDSQKLNFANPEQDWLGFYKSNSNIPIWFPRVNEKLKLSFQNSNPFTCL